MLARLKNALLGMLNWCRDAIGTLFTHLGSRKLRKQFEGEFTDEFLEILLSVMRLHFCWVPSYRENIRGYEGRLAFAATEGRAAASALFHDGQMEMRHDAVPDYDAKVTFKNPDALWAFLISDHQDILDALIEHKVETDGNLNHIFRFGFLANDLKKRLGIG